MKSIFFLKSVLNDVIIFLVKRYSMFEISKVKIEIFINFMKTNKIFITAKISNIFSLLGFSLINFCFYYK